MGVANFQNKPIFDCCVGTQAFEKHYRFVGPFANGASRTWWLAKDVIDGIVFRPHVCTSLKTSTIGFRRRPIQFSGFTFSVLVYPLISFIHPQGWKKDRALLQHGRIGDVEHTVVFPLSFLDVHLSVESFTKKLSSFWTNAIGYNHGDTGATSTSSRRSTLAVFPFQQNVWAYSLNVCFGDPWPIQDVWSDCSFSTTLTLLDQVLSWKDSRPNVEVAFEETVWWIGKPSCEYQRKIIESNVWIRDRDSKIPIFLNTRNQYFMVFALQYRN